MTARRTVPRVSVLVRFEPDLLAALDASPGDNRHAKIIELVTKGLQTNGRQTEAEARPGSG